MIDYKKSIKKGSVPKVLSKRNKRIYELKEQGVRPEKIALDYGISFVRVMQIWQREKKKYDN